MTPPPLIKQNPAKRENFLTYKSQVIEKNNKTPLIKGKKFWKGGVFSDPVYNFTKSVKFVYLSKWAVREKVCPQHVLWGNAP